MLLRISRVNAVSLLAVLHLLCYKKGLGLMHKKKKKKNSRKEMKKIKSQNSCDKKTISYRKSMQVNGNVFLYKVEISRLVMVDEPRLPQFYTLFFTYQL